MQKSPRLHYFSLAGPLRPTRKELWITLFAGLFCVSLLILRPPCLILHYFHFPCPTCGMTRAWLAALHLDFSAALQYHPMFWSVPILYIYVLRQCRVFKHPVINWLILGLILSGYLVSYLLTLVDFFHLI